MSLQTALSQKHSAWTKVPRTTVFSFSHPIFLCDRRNPFEQTITYKSLVLINLWLNLPDTRSFCFTTWAPWTPSHCAQPPAPLSHGTCVQCSVWKTRGKGLWDCLRLIPMKNALKGNSGVKTEWSDNFQRYKYFTKATQRF